MSNRKEDTLERNNRRAYEERKREERRRKNANFQTMVPRELYEEIAVYLCDRNMSKVQFIKQAYEIMKENYKNIEKPVQEVIHIPAIPAKKIFTDEYQELLSKIPKGMVTRREEIEEYFKKKYNVSNIEIEYEPLKVDTLWVKYPYWRIISTNGYLPQTTRLWSQDIQRERLEQEGLTIIPCGAYGRSLKVENFRKYLYKFLND